MKKLNVLFLCTGNSCRSQMAEGWAKALKSEEITAFSAGVETHGMNASAVQVMAEAGVSISDHHSKLVDELKDISFDYVVTVCDNARQSCPVFSGGAKIVPHGFDDPPALARSASSDEEALNHYRRVRDEIRDYIKTLPASLNGEMD